MKKRNWKLNIRRVDVERMLILCASALVVALALRQNGAVTTHETVDMGHVPVLTEGTLLTAAATQPRVVH